MAILTISVADILADIYSAMGWATQSAGQIAQAKAWMNAGYRKFLLGVKGDGSTHRWSFLKKAAQLSLVKDTQSYNLPADFAGFVIERLYFSDGTYAERVSQEMILALRTRYSTDYTSQPKYFSLYQTYAKLTGQAFSVKVLPIPDDSYTVDYVYRFNTDALTDETLNIGGPMVAECIRQLALTEMEIGNGKELGGRQALSEKLLQNAINDDRANSDTFDSQSFGYVANGLEL